MGTMTRVDAGAKFGISNVMIRKNLDSIEAMGVSPTELYTNNRLTERAIELIELYRSDKDALRAELGPVSRTQIMPSRSRQTAPQTPIKQTLATSAQSFSLSQKQLLKSFLIDRLYRLSALIDTDDFDALKAEINEITTECGDTFSHIRFDFQDGYTDIGAAIRQLKVFDEASKRTDTLPF